MFWRDVWKAQGCQALFLIVMYATGANSTADDGAEKRNGLFITSQFLNSLRTPRLSTREMFDKTGKDVIRASNG